MYQPIHTVLKTLHITCTAYGNSIQAGPSLTIGKARVILHQIGIGDSGSYVL